MIWKVDGKTMSHKGLPKSPRIWPLESPRLRIIWVVWNHLATLKLLGGVGILDLPIHMMARRFSLLQDIFSSLQPWISIIRYFVENKGLTHGRTMIMTSCWQILIGCISLKIPGPSCVQHVVISWQEALLLCV